jgi:hypothetical protein
MTVTAPLAQGNYVNAWTFHCWFKKNQPNTGVTTMRTKIRPAFLALAFSATVAAAITGLSLRGETREINIDQACSQVAWPMIPANCLEGGRGYDVRVVSADPVPSKPVPADQVALDLRFETAFQ